jgi:hypothetical protein
MKNFDKGDLARLCKEHTEEMQVLTSLSSIIQSQVRITDQLSKA